MDVVIIVSIVFITMSFIIRNIGDLKISNSERHLPYVKVYVLIYLAYELRDLLHTLDKRIVLSSIYPGRYEIGILLHRLGWSELLDDLPELIEYLLDIEVIEIIKAENSSVERYGILPRHDHKLYTHIRRELFNTSSNILSGYVKLEKEPKLDILDLVSHEVFAVSTYINKTDFI